MKNVILLSLATLILSAGISLSQSAKPDPKVPSAAPAKSKAKRPSRRPTLANVPYGKHERQVMDFYKADSVSPTPLLFFIHGGGWVAGDKSGVGELERCLAAGISVVSINYRYSWQAQLEGVMPPVEWPLADAARALQFVRSKAAEWNVSVTATAFTPHAILTRLPDDAFRCSASEMMEALSPFGLCPMPQASPH